MNDDLYEKPCLLKKTYYIVSLKTFQPIGNNSVVNITSLE